MYLKDSIFKHYGPFVDVNVKMRFNDAGEPVPTVLIGQNGAGKTLFLTNILHALIEMKREKYREIKEVEGDNYYRMGSLNYINVDAIASYNQLCFSEGALFTELATNNYKKLTETFSCEEYHNINISDSNLERTGFFSKVQAPSENVFEQGVYLYVPVERYYIPTWENKRNGEFQHIKDDEDFVGQSHSNMVCYDVLKRVEEWLLDVIIDKLLYEQKTTVFNGKKIVTYEGKNAEIQNIVNHILSIIYKHKGYDSARIGVAARTRLHRKIEIVGSKEGTEIEILPTITNMSSGEAMIFGLIAAILKEADRVYTRLNIEEIEGIVLIDEIDLHLHSDLLRNVLPELIGLFPKIQFIVSSHSPFFLLGMDELFQGKCNFIELPNGNDVSNLIDFAEIRNCYDLVNASYTETIEALRIQIDKAQTSTKPFIITEGKTDWKHIKHALLAFQKSGEFCNLDVEFLEYEDEIKMGASNLKALLEKLALVPRTNPIIGVFDNDSAEGKECINTKLLGNKVFACSIRDTQDYCDEVSIELLYPREDVTKSGEDGKRLFLSDEFKEKSQTLREDNSIVCQNKTIIDAYNRSIIKVVDSKVYDSDERNIALTKAEFADRVYNGAKPYDSISVEGFRDILSTINEIVENNK